MYQVSNDYKNAIANGNQQIALLCFPDAVFTNEDIDISGDGIEFNDYFCTDGNISIGKALSNELNFTLFNDRHLLDNYGFGEFLAYTGVLISKSDVAGMPDGVINIPVGEWWSAYSTSPYLKRDGVAVASQPTEPVICLAYYFGKVYAICENSYKVYDTDGTVASSVTVSDFMRDKAKRSFRGKGFVLDYIRDSGRRSLLVYSGRTKFGYEIVPYGWFTADRPNVGSVITLRFNCYDRMQKFEDDMPSNADLNITYPITFKNLLGAICTKVGITDNTGNFINSTAQLTARPEEFDRATMRTVVAWIAEASGSNAKIDYDGNLTFPWLISTPQSFDEHNYTEYHPFWYATPVIDKLHNRTTANSTEHTVGTGTVPYLIQDNPLLEGVT